MLLALRDEASLSFMVLFCSGRNVLIASGERLRAGTRTSSPGTEGKQDAKAGEDNEGREEAQTWKAGKKKGQLCQGKLMERRLVLSNVTCSRIRIPSWWRGGSRGHGGIRRHGDSGHDR